MRLEEVMSMSRDRSEPLELVLACASDTRTRANPLFNPVRSPAWTGEADSVPPCLRGETAMRIFYAAADSPNYWGLPQSKLWHANLYLPLADLGHELVTFA